MIPCTRFPTMFTLAVCVGLAVATFLSYVARIDDTQNRAGANATEDGLERLVRLTLEDRRFDDQLQLFRRLNEIDCQVYREVIAGHVPLREAAARCQAARDSLALSAWQEIRQTAFAGSSSIERECRRIIHGVGGMLRETADRDVVVQRLERELQSWLSLGCEVCLEADAVKGSMCP